MPAMIRSLFVVACIAVAFACTKQRPPVADPGLDGYDDARLTALVHEGQPHMSLGACRSAAVLGVLDDPAAGEKLERFVQRAAGSGIDANCVELLAGARIVRLGRLGELDLAMEMTHASAVVRATALRYAVATRSAQAHDMMVRGFYDTDPRVRIVAFRAAAVSEGPSLMDELGASSPAAEDEKFWHCVALSRWGGVANCEAYAPTMDVVISGEPVAVEPAPIDRCAQAHQRLARGPVGDGLWFFLEEAFYRYVEPLDRLEPPMRDREICSLDRAVEDEVLSNDRVPPQDRAVVAAMLLWRKHVPLGDVQALPVNTANVSLRGSVRSCVNDSNCAPHARCLRTSRRQRDGICGTPRSPRDSPQFGESAYACWSFADCPPFYSCYFTDPLAAYGLCMSP